MSFSDNYELDFGFGVGNYDLTTSHNLPADGCTQCGLCLNSCPTYQNTESIQFSPMGRIQIIRNVNEQRYDFQVQDYVALDNCLACGACETVCPSKVNYLDMLYSAKQKLEKEYSRPFQTSLLLFLLKHPTLFRMLSVLNRPLVPMFNYLQKKIHPKKTESFFTAFGLLRYANQEIPKVYSKEAVHRTKFSVSLFKGCVSSVLDRQVQEATESLLNSCGVKVHIPEGQSCCGAVHAHNGDQSGAKKLVMKNILAFQDEASDAYITSASGCSQYLRQYGKLMSSETHCISVPAQRIGDKTTDICSWLYGTSVLDGFEFNATDKIVAIHTPCSMRDDDNAVTATLGIIKKIPGLALRILPQEQSCCGAGGSAMITHPDTAKQVRQSTIDQLEALKPDILLTSNVSCSLHLKEGIREAGLSIEVLHPVQLLERQLQEKRRGFEHVY